MNPLLGVRHPMSTHVVPELSMWVDDGGSVSATGKTDQVSLYAATGEMGGDDARLTRAEVVELRDWLNDWLEQTAPEGD